MSDNTIPYGKQSISEEDIDAVIQALKSDYLTQGPKIKEFEDKFASYIGSKYAVAVANGTAALHLCTLALGVESGDKVITTPITFAASANCVLYCGGEVVFSDINPSTYLLDIDSVRDQLIKSPKGTFKGIILVDFAGRPLDLELFRNLADEFGLWIIEDACHAPGGHFKDSKYIEQRCGNGVYADLAIFSFHPVKHIACGEGGMITTNNESLYQKLIMLRTHGITKDEGFYLNDCDIAFGNYETINKDNSNYPGWYMEMQMLGYNYRLTDIQAALGVSQLIRADDGLYRRREIAGIYFNAFKDKNYILGQSGIVEGHAYHLYIIEVKDRAGLYTYLKENKIYAQVHYIPCHLMPHYKKIGWELGDFPNAEKYYSNCLSLPMYPTLKHEEQLFVISKINDFFTLGQA